MNNLFLPLILFFTFSNISAQGLTYDDWETTAIVDDFGDPTGDKVTRYFSQGKFSNSATTNEDMTFKFVDYGKNEKGEGTAQIDIFEYNRTKAQLAFETSLGVMKCKMPDGSVKSYQLYALKSGGLALWGKYYNEFMEMLNNGKGEKIRFVLSESDFSDYGRAKYQGHFHTKTSEDLE